MLLIKSGFLEEIYNDMEKGVYNFCKDGKCIGCGSCCSNYLPLSAKEIKDIKRYMRKYHIKEFKHIFPTSDGISIDMTCPFLNDSKDCDKCMIYSVRPMICREFQCNKPPSKIESNKKMFWKNRKAFDMRETFFSKEGGNDG